MDTLMSGQKGSMNGSRKFRIPGILGGMGPESTVKFIHDIVNATEAQRDQDHIPLLLYMATQVPDRVEAFLGKGPSPVDSLFEGICSLKSSGADFIAIPCNSAHLWFDELVARTGAQILNMIDLALSEIHTGYRVGIIGTTLTVKSRLYENPLSERGIEVVLPEDQDFVMEQIRGIKAGKTSMARNNIQEIADQLVGLGATHILYACTEISFAVDRKDISVPAIDPMMIMARKCVELAGGRLKHP